MIQETYPMEPLKTEPIDPKVMRRDQPGCMFCGRSIVEDGYKLTHPLLIANRYFHPGCADKFTAVWGGHTGRHH